MTTPRQLRALYEQGVNITSVLRAELAAERNTEEIIEIAYDLQTGSYIAALEDADFAAYHRQYTAEIARTILALCAPLSILEAGVGEATTLCGVLQKLPDAIPSFAFDLSWSRVAYAKRWLTQRGSTQTTLCTGTLQNIPFADDSVDIVYTSHAIEPNGGNEETILRELYRVTGRFLILLEPGYELATDEARQRMDSHGYCKNLRGIANALGYEVLTHKLFPYTANPLNPTALTIIRKRGEPPTAAVDRALACPLYKTPLMEIDNMLFSPEALRVYPIVGGIPCLRIENGIFASKFNEVMAP